MIDLSHFHGKKVLVYGCGLSGQASIEALKNFGAAVRTWDDLNPQFQDMNPQSEDLSSLDAIVISPGIPISAALKETHVPIVGDVELFWQAIVAPGGPPCQIVAITGTNGKSTTTALLTHVLKANGFEAHMGGNIGIPILQLPAPKEDGSTIYVIEMSSYQIDLIKEFSPHVAMLLNISPDHIDRYGSLQAYANSKKRLLTQCLRYPPPFSQKQKRAAPLGLIGMLDDICRSFYEELVSQHPHLIPISNTDHVNEAFVRAACEHYFGLSPQGVEEGLGTFQNLPHRFQTVAERDGIEFINDSKATNAHATQRAFEQAISKGSPIFWIAGGLPKEGGIQALSQFFSSIHSAYFIGQAGPEFLQTFSKHSQKPVACHNHLQQALEQAFRDAKTLAAPCTILFSPACASFDQFKNFEDRGEKFSQMVQSLL